MSDVTVILTYSPDEARRVANLVRTVDRSNTLFYDDHDRLLLIASAIERSLPKPKPTEPTGLGAVVEDAKGYVYVRGYEVSDTFTHPWHVIDPCANACMAWWKYADIDVARIVHEGVTA